MTFKTCAACNNFGEDPNSGLFICKKRKVYALYELATDCEEFEEISGVTRLNSDALRMALQRNAGLSDKLPVRAKRKCPWCEKLVRLMDENGDIVYHCKYDNEPDGWVKQPAKVNVPKSCVFKPLPINTDALLVVRSLNLLTELIAEDLIPGDVKEEEVVDAEHTDG